MTEINDDRLVTTLASEDGNDDVEAHGMREVAVGIGVAAAVLGGSAGVADASHERGPIGDTTGTITTTIHGGLEGEGSLKTMRATSNLLRPQTKKANLAADDADARTQAAAELATNKAGEAQQTVNDALAEADRQKKQAENKAAEIQTQLGEEVGRQIAAGTALVEAAEQQVRQEAGTAYAALMTIKANLEADAAAIYDALQEDVKEVERQANGLISMISGIVTSTLGQAQDLLNSTVGTLKGVADDLLAEANAKKTFVEDEAAAAQTFAKDEVARQKTGAETLVAQKKAEAVTLITQKKGEVEEELRTQQAFAKKTAADTVQFGHDTKAAVDERVATELTNAKNEANAKVQAGMTALQGVATDADTMKDGAVSQGISTARGAGTTVQQGAESAVTTVTGAPQIATDKVIETVATVQQTWTQTTENVEAPPVEKTVAGGTQKVEDVAASLPDAGGTVGGVSPPTL